MRKTKQQRAAERRQHQAEIRREVADKLKIVRKYTGHNFSLARGYDGRKNLSRSRQKTIAKYFDIIYELSGRAHKLYTPPKGAKREVFAFTGQDRTPKFTKAIIYLPDADATYKFEIDKNRPKGSRFVVTNKKTHERSWRIPAEVFLDENEALFDEDEDTDPDFFEGVLEEYGQDGAAYMVEAGDYHMWGSAGPRSQVANKLSDLFKNYGAGHFDPYDRNSHFIGNWFRGVQVFADPLDLLPYKVERYRNDLENQKKFGRGFGEHIRTLADGSMVRFVGGKMIAETRIYPKHRKRRAYGKYKRAR